MKILVPTDFSEFSNYAIEAAKKLALRINGQVDFFHCVPKNALLSIYVENQEVDQIYQSQIEAFVQRKLEESVLDFRANDIHSEYNISYGNFLHQLKKLQENGEYDLVVVGSHGQSGIRNWAMGSNAQKIVRKLPCYTMVVKKPLDNIDFSQAVFVTGLNVSDQIPFKMFLKFIENLNVDMLYILAVDTALYFTQPRIIMQEALKDFKEIAEGFNVNTHFYSDYSIEAGVRHFVDEKGISLIGISNHDQHPVQRIFTGSNVEAIVNQSKVPVISINYKE